MKTASLLLLLAAFCSVGGCVQSLHPFYIESQLTYDEKLIGKWTNDDKESFVVTGDAESKEYQVEYTDKDGKIGKFQTHLANANGQLILDITPQEFFRDDASDTYAAHLLPVHSFLLVERVADDENVLKIRAMDYDWVANYLEKNPAAVAHEKIDKDRIILTAAAEKVQAFVLAHVKTEGAYSEPAVLKRVTDAAAPPAPPSAPK